MVMPTNCLSGECLVSRGFSGIEPESMTSNLDRTAQEIALFGLKKKEKH
jgi:hypothetical protein